MTGNLRHALRGIVLLLAGVAVFTAGAPQTAQAQPMPRVELYTMGAGDTIFSYFGHAALCVFDSRAPEGRCYNYGTADFNQPLELSWGVMRGEAPFWVSVITYKSVAHMYKKQDRTLYRQVLPLTPEATKRMIALLHHDAKPENRHYIYDHFFDNCATRLRDHIDTALGGRFAQGTDVSTEAPFRDYVRNELSTQPGLLTLSEIFVGRSMDTHNITHWEAMFLPHVMRTHLHKNFGVVPEVLYQRTAINKPGNPQRGQHILLGLALLAAAATIVTSLSSKPRRRRAGLVMAGLTLGGIGLLMGTLAIVSSVPELRSNEMLLIFLPTDLLLLKLDGVKLRRYLALRLALLAVVVILALTGVLIQPVWAPMAWVLGWLTPLTIAAFYLPKPSAPELAKNQ